MQISGSSASQPTFETTYTSDGRVPTSASTLSSLQAAGDVTTSAASVDGSTSTETDDTPALAPAVSFLTEAEVAELSLGMTPTAVTAESLLENTETRLEDVDGQILEIYRTINERRVQSDAITSDIQALQQLQTAMGAENKTGDERIALTELTVQTENGTQSAVEFIREHDLASALGLEEPLEEKKISGSQIESGIDALRSAQSQLNSRTEMDMMSMQQLVHQRSQVIELATKMLEAMHQSEKAILANLGR